MIKVAMAALDAYTRQSNALASRNHTSVTNYDILIKDNLSRLIVCKF